MSKAYGEMAFEAIKDAEPTADNLIELPILLVEDEAILPHTIAPLSLEDAEPSNIAVIKQALHNKQTAIYAISQQLSELTQNHLTDRQIGTEVAVVEIKRTTSKSNLVMIQGRRRVEIVKIIPGDAYPTAQAHIVDEHLEVTEQIEHLRESILQLYAEIAERGEFIPEEVVDYIFGIEDFSELADTIASTLPIEPKERQRLLATVPIEERLTVLEQLMQDEARAIDVLEDVHHQVEDEMARVQREMYLREQMRIIQQELGEGDVFQQELDTLHERLIEAQLPEEAQKQAMRELSRLHIMPPMAPEASVIRTYIDWLLDLPWHTKSKDNLNLRHAEKVLDSAHYGLEKVKERVLEHIAVRKLAGNEMRTPILCFVGPPGVGKTSLGKSIADALGRQFVRVSLGGVRDEAEIRGHRRTYIGAMPGRIINTIKRTGTINPVFMLDEIDKMSEDYRGDPAAALLEVLDPEQNHEFTDHYLEVPYDLSKVLFIATANSLFPLPEALEDRLEVIEFRAYTEEEKIEIAKRFLIPKQLKAHGLARRGINFLDSAIIHVIRHYTLEAGVRNLEREIANILRKITRMAAMRKKYPRRITTKQVEKSLGPPYLIDSHINREDRIGIVTGLVWTSGGGDIQIIEASLIPGKGNLTLTGQLGEVLQESAQIGLNYMRTCADEMDIPHDDFETYDVHIHMPEGAVPKDGPSAGITLAIALISVFTERKIRSDWAMTGEVTLRGHVLPVGGIKEKVLAARRRGIKNVILPDDNKKDLVDIPAYALRQLNVQFVSHMQEVIDLVLLETPEVRERDQNYEESGNLDEDEDN